VVAALAQSTGLHEPVSPEADQALRYALSQMDPKAGDTLLGYGEVLSRLLAAVDRQLFVWTSGQTQAPGPSGDIQVAQPPEVPAPEPPARRRHG